MKILKLHFKNINSLEGEHEIDFTKKPFTTNNLFAITGPTGSGKSTILDVIPLALYNRIPRLEANVSKKMMDENGAILTRGQKDAFARVTYACKQGVFKSEWTVRIARTGNLQDYEMFLYDEEGKPITQKKSEVPPQNEALIGLNYDQFIKSVMLAQGEFSRFLKVKKEERSALLEQITGTAIYRRLGVAAYEKFKGFKNSVEEWEKKKEDLKAGLLSGEALKAKKEQESVLNQKERDKRLDLQKTEKLIELHHLFENKKKQVSKLKEDAEKIQVQLTAFIETAGVQLSWHEKTEPFGDQLLQWHSLHQEQRQLEKEITAKQAEKEEANTNVQRLKAEIEKWTNHQAILEEEVEKTLDAFYKKIDAWENQRKDKLSEYQELKTRINSELKVLDLSFKETSKQYLLNELEKTQSFLKPLKISGLTKNDYLIKKEKLQTALENLHKAEKKATSILNDLNYINQKSEQLKIQKDEKGELGPKLKELEVLLKENDSDVKILELKLENKNLERTLIDYRRGLKENQPCPVCGSTHHPWSEKPIEATNELKEKLNEAKSVFNENNHNKIRLEENYSNLEKRIASGEKEIKEIENRLSPLIKAFKTDFSNFSLEEDFSGLIEIKNKELKAWEKIYEAFQKLEALEKALPLYDSLKLIVTEGQVLKNKIDQATGGKEGYTTTQNFLKKWNNATAQLKNATKNLLETTKEKKAKAKIFKDLENHLLSEVKAVGFTSILSAFSHRLAPQEAQKLKIQRTKLEQEIRQLNTAKEVHESELETLAQQVEGIKVFELQQQKENIEFFLEKIKKEQKEIFAQLNQQKIYRQQIRDLEDKIKQENKESYIWRMLNQLIGDAKGKNFNDFAQDLTLNHLLHLANKRLSQLESRYWLTQPHQEEDDGLMAIDQDMGNQRRSVKTLSGGETFILSLALALALSDLASKNVRIETLFIDEGFGTLDPETLDKTLDTLERLQQENQKMIGVISHVELLKDRISTQVQLKQNGNGLSVMQVVG